jgi:Uma2 family endonuclease
MHFVAAFNAYSEVTVVPRIAVRLPLALPEPEGFEMARPETWPGVTGRLEYVSGRLEYMPPCGEVQQRTVADVITELNLWRRQHPEFAVGGNEAGMLLGGEVRAADAAVWRGAGRAHEGFARAAPILAVEVASVDDHPDALLDKARWYLTHGVETVWIVLPQLRRVRVVTAAGIAEVDSAERLPEPESLTGLAPFVGDFFSSACVTAITDQPRGWFPDTSQPLLVVSPLRE